MKKKQTNNVFSVGERAAMRLLHTGWSYRTISEWLGITEGAVNMRISLAIRKAGVKNAKELRAKIDLRPSWLGNADEDFIGRLL